MNWDAAIAGAICTVLSAAFTSIGFLFQSNKNLITRSEMENYVAESSPWMKDKTYVLSQLSTITTEMGKINNIQIEQARMNMRLDEFNHKLDHMAVQVEKIVTKLSER